jgi:hypothetical protein
MRKRSHASLKGLSAYYLANELNMTPDSLYERQRALMRAGLIKGKEGWGPGSGVRATPHAVAMLLIAVLAADSLSDVVESTKRYAWLRAEQGVCPITGKKTFGSSLVAILASPSLARKAHTIRVFRGGMFGPGAVIDWLVREENPVSWFSNPGARKHPWGILDIEASLRGFPLSDLAGLLLAVNPGASLSAPKEDLEAMKGPSRKELLEHERQHHPTRKK